MPPSSVVRVIMSATPSWPATMATPSGTPIPRFTTMFGRNSIAARRAMNRRLSRGSSGSVRRRLFFRFVD